MSFRALLVTSDDQAAQVLEPVLTRFGLVVERSPYSEALGLVSQQKFHSVLVDFDDPERAAPIFENLSGVQSDHSPVTVALISDREKVRQVFGAGANFVVFKPISAEQSEGALLAATAIVQCERRSSLRVPIQVAIKLQLRCEQEAVETDGILLDLSETGMDVLAAQPLYTSANVTARFTLPNSPLEFAIGGEVAWANPNGESGLRFTDIPESLRTALASWVEENSRESSTVKSDSIPGYRLTDLSLGGCYVETSSPFPERTVVNLSLGVEGADLQTQGVVRVMHPSRGMGIEFAALTSEEREQTARFIQHLTERPGIRPELQVFPKTLPAGAHEFSAPSTDLEDPLLELLRNHQAFSEDTFLEALRSQRRAELLKSRL